MPVRMCSGAFRDTLPYTSQPVVRVTPETIKLQGGALALDFANSVDWTEDDAEIAATDALLEPDSLERWGARLGVAGSPGGAEELELARGLRAALHRLFSALAREQEPEAFALSRLRFAYAQAVAAGMLVPREEGGFGLDWRATSRAACASPSPPMPSRCSPIRPASRACTAARAATAGGCSSTPAAAAAGARWRPAAAARRCAGCTSASARASRESAAAAGETTA